MEIVAFSGGKDSTAMALLLNKMEPNKERKYLYTPTGNELPEMYSHMTNMIKIFGPENFITPEVNGLVQLIREQKCIPNWRMRWCTRMIKIEPCIEYLKNVKSPILCVGLRADEENRRGLYDDHVTSRFPLREYGFTIQDVYDFLEHENVEIPERTDCALCYYQRLIDWFRLWENHPGLYDEGEQLEIEIGHTFRSETKDKHPSSLKDLRIEFEKGWVPKYRRKRIEDRGGCRVCSM